MGIIKGHWNIVGHEEVIPGLIFLIKECSECRFQHSLNIPDDYCPKCGSHNGGKYEPTIEEYLNDHRS